jgi:hypothetical protein
MSMPSVFLPRVNASKFGFGPFTGILQRWLAKK